MHASPWASGIFVNLVQFSPKKLHSNTYRLMWDYNNFFTEPKKKKTNITEQHLSIKQQHTDHKHWLNKFQSFTPTQNDHLKCVCACFCFFRQNVREIWNSLTHNTNKQKKWKQNREGIKIFFIDYVNKKEKPIRVKKKKIC